MYTFLRMFSLVVYQKQHHHFYSTNLMGYSSLRVKGIFTTICGILWNVFPEKKYTIFGDSEKLPMQVTNFLFDTGYDLSFLYYNTRVIHLFSATYPTSTVVHKTRRGRTSRLAWQSRWPPGPIPKQR